MLCLWRNRVGTQPRVAAEGGPKGSQHQAAQSTPEAHSPGAWTPLQPLDSLTPFWAAFPHTPQGWWSPDPPPRRAVLGREQTPASGPPCRWTRQGYGRGAAGLGRERATFWPGSHMGHCGPACAAVEGAWTVLGSCHHGGDWGQGSCCPSASCSGLGFAPQRESKDTGSSGCGQVLHALPQVGLWFPHLGRPATVSGQFLGLPSFLPLFSPAPTPPPQASSSFWKEARQMARRLHQT